MITLDQIRAIADQAVANPYPHDGLKQFMDSCQVQDPYYAFLYELSKTLQPDAAIETGTELGRAAFSIAMGCPSCQLTTIELGSGMPDTWPRFLGQCSNIRIVTGTLAQEWLCNPYNRRRKFGLAFLDSDHHFETVLAEYSLLRPLMEPGSVICWDDSVHAGPLAVLKEVSLPKILFDGTDGPKLHGENGFAVAIIPKD